MPRCCALRARGNNEMLCCGVMLCCGHFRRLESTDMLAWCLWFWTAAAGGTSVVCEGRGSVAM